MKLPVYEFVIDETREDSGVKAISLVSSPAIDSEFIAFNKDQKKPQYIFLEKDEKEYKGIVAGLSLIPNKLIYRVDGDGNEYYGYFSKDTVEKIRNKYHKELMTSNVNLEHDENQYISAYLIESYLLDTEDRVNEVKNKGIADAEDGAWYTALKIDDKEVFQKVLDGDYQGFSVEAFLNKELKSLALSNNNNNILKLKKMKKTFVEKLREQFAKMLDKLDFESALVPEFGFTITWGEVGEGVTKTYQDTEGNEVTEATGAGEFTLEDGRIVVVDDNSMLVEIRDAVEETPEETPEEDMRKKGKTKLEENQESVDVIYGEVGESVDIVIAEEEKPIEEIITIEETMELPLETGEILVIDDAGDLVEIKEEEETPSEEETPEEETPSEEEMAKKAKLEEPVVETKSDLDKSLKELLDLSKNGEYSVMVSVYDGKVSYGAISSWQEIKLSMEEEIKKLKEKLSQPIADPILTDKKEIEGHAKELTVYQKIIKRRGLPEV